MSPFQVRPDGVRVALRVTPRAGRDALAGLWTGGADTALAVKVAAAPADGDANDAVLRLLARSWDVPLSALNLVSGATGRRKIVMVTGEPARLLPLMQASVETM